MKEILIATIFIFSASACSERRSGPFERAGSRTDEIVDNVQEGKPLLHKKGPLEKTGEAIDDTIHGKK